MRAQKVAISASTNRRLDAQAMTQAPDGSLMRRAAWAVGVSSASILGGVRGRVTGSRVVIAVGSGDNGGDGLYAGVYLVRRGARVDAVLMSDRWHESGAEAFVEAGGRLSHIDDLAGACELVERADLLIDAIAGVGGRGPLRPAASTLFGQANSSGIPVLSIDVPTGVDSDTGSVSEGSEPAAVVAVRTVVMGALKPGLLLGAGRSYAGAIEVIDLGLDLDSLPADEVLVHVDDGFAGSHLARPTSSDDKYSRGVVGLSTGSAKYPGAAVLSAGGARTGLAGFVRYCAPADTEVIRAWPDVVATSGRIADAGRVQCWVVGSGRGTDEFARAALEDCIATDVPLVLDADALTLLANDDQLRAAVVARTSVTVLTPHAGEFARLAGRPLDIDQRSAVRELAARFNSVVLLKGSATLVGGSSGEMYVATSAPPELATAGSGDVLAGFLGSLLAHAAAHGPVSDRDAALLAGVAAHTHGLAGALATTGGRTITAVELLSALPVALGQLRRLDDMTGTVPYRVTR
ncbi:MAG: NAD(P)H-hydrate epimerase [Actinomycetes bacterium]